MGQKVNPVGLRIGITHSWDSKWYAEKKRYAELFHQDIQIRKTLFAKLKEAGVSRIEILRTPNHVSLNIHTSRPGMVIGGQGAAIDDLRDFLDKKFNQKFHINVHEIKKPYQDAVLLSELIGKQVERRIPYRRACKMTIERAMESGAKGIKVLVAGRLNGVEIARSEIFSAGKIPLHTFRANIDYALFRAITTYGTIGVKVWVYLGEVFKTTTHARETIQQSS